MKSILLPAAFAVAVTGLALSSTPAPARGCLKGAVIGGVAGHFAGHHGLLGAGAGCVIGITRPASTPASASGPTVKGMAAAPRPMITVTDTVPAEPRGAAAVAAPTQPGSDLQNFRARSGFELASVHRHSQHAVIADGAGQLDEALIAEPLPE